MSTEDLTEMGKVHRAGDIFKCNLCGGMRQMGHPHECGEGEQLDFEKKVEDDKQLEFNKQLADAVKEELLNPCTVCKVKESAAGREVCYGCATAFIHKENGELEHPQ